MYILGDTHRNWHHVKGCIDRMGMRDTEIFHVGDYGVGFISREKDLKLINDFNNWLNERGIIMYVIRGNHDDPYFFEGEHLYSNLQFLPDYTVIEIEYHKILCVGGAISPDRFYGLLENKGAEKHGQIKTHWEDEGFILREDILENITGIDTVITHTAPTYCTPKLIKGIVPKFIERFEPTDANIYDDITDERKKLDKMFEILNIKNNIKYHFYGHFHRYDITDNLYTQHIVLDKCELYEVV